MNIFVNENLVLFREIEKFADKVIYYIAKANKDIFDDYDEDKIYVDYVFINSEKINPNEFKDVTIQNMINRNFVVSFKNNLKSGGVYIARKSKNDIDNIVINPSAYDIKKSMEYFLSQYDNVEQITNEKGILWPLKTMFSVTFKDILVHELRHFYDEVKSSGKYRADKRSINYYKNLYHKNTSEKRREYYNLPHEYWARFTEFVANNINKNFKRIDFQRMLSDFKYRNRHWWGDFDKQGKKKIIKALYKFHSQKKEEDEERERAIR